MHRQTKIIATLGPSVASLDAIAALIDAGMDVARINFSHGNQESNAQLIRWVREAAARAGRPVAVLQDIQGPKIRVGVFPAGEIYLERGATVELVTGEWEGDAGRIPIGYERLGDDVMPGHRVILADGLVELEVVDSAGGSLKARVVTPGVLSDHKGVSLPDSNLSTSNVTPKDVSDLELGQRLGVDYIAASFVRTREDVEAVRALCGDAPIIAKIELARALDNLDEIIAASFGVMVARGDLGVQLPLERLPLIQRDILTRSNAMGRVTVTATEMLESMTHNPRPTRAEVTDVAIAVLSGTDAVMLSGETAVGAYPVETVATMSRICHTVEAGTLSERGAMPVAFVADANEVASAVAQAACQIALNVRARFIVAFTESGSTARLISKYRPEQRVHAFSPLESTRNRMALFWGVTPHPFDRRGSTDEEMAEAAALLEQSGTVEEGENVVMVAGVPPNVRASTNLVKVHRIGEPSGLLGG